MPSILQHWDDDLGGRSTRDFIEESVVEAIAEAIDSMGGAPITGTAELDLDVAPAFPPAGGGEAGDVRVVCRVRDD